MANSRVIPPPRNGLDHQVTLSFDRGFGGERGPVDAAGDLHSADANASGSPVSSGAGLVGSRTRRRERDNGSL